MCNLPIELIGEIVQYTDFETCKILKNYIPSKIFELMRKNILIYGNVQSGKTNIILNILKDKDFTNQRKVVVIQNSLLVLKQYEERMKKKNISFQVIDKHTKKIDKNVIFLINNKFRYNYFLKFNLINYILILDEADMIFPKCPLEGFKNFHITATPFSLNNHKYDDIIYLKRPKNYFDWSNIQIKSQNVESSINDLLKYENGMMLINKFTKVKQMKEQCEKLSAIYRNIPIVLLTKDKILYHNNQIKNLKMKSISLIIDSLKNHKHIIFIAYKLSSRGLSYVSSDYKRHLTYQLTTINSNKPTSLLQRLRIFGIYKTQQKLKLILENEEQVIQFNDQIKFVENFSF